MAEKRVSVRLVAEGGRQVRAELAGIGEAGARGFGRLSTEMDLANAHLGRFARKAGIALAAVTVAAAAAGVAMIRSGLSNVDAQAKLAQSMRTTVESVQTLTWAGELAGVAMGEIEQATKKLTTRLSEAATGSGSAVGALQRLNLTAAALQAMPLDQRIIAIQEALNQFVPEAERAAVASDLFGDRAALAFLRIDPATLRAAAQDVRDFGVAVSATDAAQIERTGDAIARLNLIWIGLTNRLTVAVAPALEVVANALAEVARGAGPVGRAVTTLVGNIGRITSYAATFAAVMAGRWVAGLAAAALSVRGLATGLLLLRGALIRTGIGALIVGAGELVYWFTRLASGAGGFGAAMGLLKDVAVEVWGRIRIGAASAGASATAMFHDLKADAAMGMASAIDSVVGFGNTAANTFEGALLAVKEIWARLPSVIGDLVFSAANRMLGGIEAMLNGAIRRIDSFTGKIRDALAAVGIETTFGQIGEINLGDIPNPFAGASADAGTAAAEAFRRAFADNPLTAPDLGLTGIAAEALATANTYRQAATDLAAGATAPLASWQALKDAVRGAGADGADALDDAQASTEALADGLDVATTAAKTTGGAVKTAAEVAATGWGQVSIALADYAKGAMDWGKGLGETLTSAFQSAESAFRSFITTGKVDFKSLVSSILADLAVLAFKRTVLGPIASALSGVFGGLGSGGTNPLVNASIWHAGGIVGGAAPLRAIPALAFAGAPRMHAGGWAGLKPDEVPAILQRGERVLSRREVAGAIAAGNAAPGVTIHIDARGAQAGVAEQIDARLRAAIPEITRLAKASVADGRKRGHAL